MGRRDNLPMCSGATQNAHRLGIQFTIHQPGHRPAFGENYHLL